MKILDKFLEADLLPDSAIRFGIRRLLASTLREHRRPTAELRRAALLAHAEGLKKSPIAIRTQAANQQHYEVPAEFYRSVLGSRLKYSSGLWLDPSDTLDVSEERMLDLTCRRAEIADGQAILELGCGWGSLSLWMAERYPRARITAVSNSRAQKEHIDAAAARAGLRNLFVMTRDMNTVEFDRTFDRVVSVEMFEHMKNYRLLLGKVAGWLAPDGKLFVHIFTHRECAYHFEDKGPDDWMARHFFSGGQMPSDDLLLHFQDDLACEERWAVDGRHYQKTSEAWLERMDANRDRISLLFEATYGPARTRQWRAYWRIFFMSCAELFGYRDGSEWHVMHYRFVKAGAPSRETPRRMGAGNATEAFLQT